MNVIVRWLCVPLVTLLLVLATGQAQGQETGSIQIVQGGTGEGTITSDPAGIDCILGGPDGPIGSCEASFAVGTKVKLKAKPAPGSKFEGWAPVTSCPKANNLTVEAGRTHNCQPVFSLTEPAAFLLQTLLVGSGTVTSEPGGITCTQDADTGILSGECGNTFASGSTVTLTATPREGWAFQGWSGENRDRDCDDGVVTMDQAHRCTATFVRL
jgi:hypothetical protein